MEMQVRTLNEAHEQRRRGFDGGTGTMRGSNVPGKEDKAGQGKARQGKLPDERRAAAARSGTTKGKKAIETKQRATWKPGEGGEVPRQANHGTLGIVLSATSKYVDRRW